MRRPTYSHPSEQFTGRLLRSLENPLHLLHHSDSHFYILGATGNVYTVTLSTNPTCNCPDAVIPCKHILFVYIRVLSLPVDDPLLRRTSLRPCELTRLLSALISGEYLAEKPARKRFLELNRHLNKKKLRVTVEDGATCPVCLDDRAVAGGGAVVACPTCKNTIHEKCWMTWKNKGSSTCVICRAKWREVGDEGKYINLSAYVTEDYP